MPPVAGPEANTPIVTGGESGVSLDAVCDLNQYDVVIVGRELLGLEYHRTVDTDELCDYDWWASNWSESGQRV